MSLTHEDFQKARRISRAIQQYLIDTGQKYARSTDVYQYLARKGLIEKDRHEGLHFRKFLIKLKTHGMLQLIPQCIHRQSETGGNEWYFYPVSDDKAELNDIKQVGKKAEITHAPQMTKDEIIQLLNIEEANVEKLPKRDTSNFTFQELEIRRNYPRAYEYWTRRELNIIKKVYIASKNVDKVAELVKRQPHIIREKLQELHLL